MSSAAVDPEILELIPHRPPMLLINKISALDQNSSQAIVTIDANAPFVESQGVPSWIGLEYMGQTAALIAGYQLREGLTQPHLGFLLGTRNYRAEQAYFNIDSELLVSCQEAALVGDSLATFDCTIQSRDDMQILATANLSVFRKPIEK
ncbi:MAG: hypothetical protein KTR16_16550 [Acidiferrobacterales bacterium]|nr:hypothetical protein [Acidiferrobacterales bacterium]